MTRLLVIVPAFNEAPVLAQVLKGIKKQVPQAQILVVDDGSVDQTASVAQSISQVILIRHLLNRGLGAAISTGLKYAQAHRFDVAVTFDADGQHYPQDIPALVSLIANQQADVVIGSRTLSHQGQLPFDRRIIIFASNLLTWILYGQSTTDSLSGFRAFSRKAITNIQIKTDRMEVSNELFAEIKRLNLKLAEVPIKVLYTDYSRSKGQKNVNAFAIVFKLMLRLFR